MNDGVVVAGGGFGGFWAAVAARRTGGDSLPITLVSPQPELVMRPRLYEASPETLAVDMRPLLDLVGVEFVADSAVGLDVEDHTLDLAAGGLPFGRLVVATGSVMRRPPVPGAETAFSIDTQADAVDFDRRLAAVAQEPAPSVIVVGAGFTGVELALELRDRLVVHGGTNAAEALRIVLVDRSDEVAPELGAGPRPAISAALDAARVELRLGVTVARLAPESVELAGGETVAADAVVLATGLAAAPFAARVPGEHDDAGRVLVDEYLRAPEAPTIFVTGDAAAADTGDGHLALQSCQHALQLGRVAGENAARDLIGRSLVQYAQPRYVTCLDLGRSGAVFTQGWNREVEMTGAEAKARKTMINTQVIYPPGTGDTDALIRASEIDPAARG